MRTRSQRSEGSSSSSFPFVLRQSRNIFFDRPAFEHLVRRHMLYDDPVKRQFRTQFESILGLDNVSLALANVEISLAGNFLPAARRLAELVAGDTEYWVSYRRESEGGETIDQRLNVFLQCGLIVIFQMDGQDWHLRTAFFTSDRGRANSTRRVNLTRKGAIVHQIRNHFGTPIQINGQDARKFDPLNRYREIKGVVQSDFALSYPAAFGLQPADVDDGRRLFNVNHLTA